jgi:hypothetical protein
MSTLSEFLLSCVDTDEREAREAQEEAPALTWQPTKVYDGIWSIDLGPATHPDADSYEVGPDCRMPREMARHIARHDPARVLADCAALRAVVELCSDNYALDPSGLTTWVVDQVLRIEAQRFKDRPGWDETWGMP